MNELRIVLLGKTGHGKSSTANTILDKDVFHTGNSPNSITHKCESKENVINGRKITVVDGPGFFDTSLPEKVLNGEILRCITECAPGLHAFLIVLRVERYTEQEIEVVKEITASFGEDALRYAVVLFTHGDQLSENMTIQDFVAESTELQDLVEKCGGRVHVIDNKYWKQQQDGYRSNRVQVENLLNTIEEMVKKNGGRPYTNEMLQRVHRAIEEEFTKTRNEGGEKDRREQAKKEVQTKLSVKLVAVGTGILVGAFLGCATALAIVMSFIMQQAAGTVASRVTQAAGLGAGAAGGVFAVSATVGGAAGGIVGYDAAKKAETMTEAMRMAASETFDIATNVKEKIQSCLKQMQTK